MDITADGACRGNNVKNAKRFSAIGVFAHSYDMSFKATIDAQTNNAAEIASANAATEKVISIHKQYPNITTFRIQMDSSYVISGINDGYHLRFHDSAYVNSAAWAVLGTSIAAIPETCTVHWEWIPRHLNVCADELANAALDKRQVDTTIQPPDANSPRITSELLQAALRGVMAKRCTAIKHIPPSLDILLLAFISSFYNRTSISQDDKRVLFVLTPALISSYSHCPTVRNSSEFKHLRNHLNMLSQESYLVHHLTQLVNRPVRYTDPPDERAETDRIASRILGLCRVGAFHKCLPRLGSEIERNPSEATLDTIEREAFASGPPTPDPLPIGPPIVMTWGELLAAFKKLHSHKGTCSSGWSKELLYPVFRAVHLQMPLLQFFTAFINTNITQAEIEVFTTSIALVIRYPLKDKRRMVLNSDTLLKTSWHCVLRDKVKRDPILQRSVQTYGLPRQCQVASHAVQMALDNKVTVTQLDATSAFPTIDRRATFHYLHKHRHHYSDTFPLMNLLYAQKTSARFYTDDGYRHFIIHQGSLQGCVSGPPVYTLGTIETSSAFPRQLIQIADDTHLLQTGIKDAVVLAFARINQNMNGDKTKLITPTSAPTRVLGGYALPSSAPPASLLPSIQPILDKVSQKYAAIRALPALLQCKLLITRSVTWDWVYYFQTTHPTLSRHLAKHIDQEQRNTLFHLFPMLQQTQVRNVPRIFLPVEDGGLGLVPYEDLYEWMYYHMRRAVIPDIRSKFDIDIPDSQMYPIDVTPNSIRHAWRTAFKESLRATRTKYITLSARAFMRESPFTSWLDVWPTTKTVTLADDRMLTAIYIRYDCLPAPQYICATDNVSVSTLTPEQFSRHFQVCKSCAAFHHIPRHEAVLRALHRTCSFHLIHSTIMKPFDMPIHLDKPKSASDLLVITGEDRYNVDLAITVEDCASAGHQFQDRLKVRFGQKKFTYRKFEASTNNITVPFIMSIYGVIPISTITLIESWFQRSLYPQKCKLDIFANTQFELINSLHHGLHRLISSSATKITPNPIAASLERTQNVSNNVPANEAPPSVSITVTPPSVPITVTPPSVHAPVTPVRQMIPRSASQTSDARDADHQMINELLVIEDTPHRKAARTSKPR